MLDLLHERVSVAPRPSGPRGRVLAVLDLEIGLPVTDVSSPGWLEALMRYEGVRVERLRHPAEIEACAGAVALVFGGDRLGGTPEAVRRVVPLESWIHGGGTALFLIDRHIPFVGGLGARTPGWALVRRLQAGANALLAEAPGTAEDGRIPLPGGGRLVRLAFGSGSILLGRTALVRPSVAGSSTWAAALVEALTELVPDETDHEVHARMQGPQRHRLLQGYPMRPMMGRLGRGDRFGRAAGATATAGRPRYEPGRALLVGVLPHAFCNPAVAGCGFCTFPHERFSTPAARGVVQAVIREVQQRVERSPDLRGRPVAGLYFGGGTANLTPPDAFRDLCRALAATFDLSGAEVSLEGVPAYFLRRRPPLVDILREELPARHFRISMGIQTFDPARLAAMGRSAYGDAVTFEEVVRLAHDRGFTASADLLFNLPHQPLDAMRADVHRAVALGLDQVCLYHLVMFPGLNTGWSADPALLAGLPANPQAADHWVALRQELLDAGFKQTTLTNFERPDPTGGYRYTYEVRSMCPETHDVLGFGPAGISFAADAAFRSAVKLQNPERSREYLRAVEAGPPVAARAFAYEPEDLRLLYLTRKVALLGVERAAYRATFGTDPVADFPRELAALERAGLVATADDSIRLTPRGMFYSDTVAGLLARRRVRALKLGRFLDLDRRRRQRPHGLRHDPNRAAAHHMG